MTQVSPSLTTGYFSAQYAAAFAEWGVPRRLTDAGGWILERPISNRSDRDAMGCYPIFCCNDWDQLPADLNRIDDLVSLIVVTDPFADVAEASLQAAFADLMRPYKRHFLVDLAREPDSFVNSHHLRNARRAAQTAKIVHGEPSESLLRTWIALYRILIDRHAIRGLAAFSERSFAAQFEVPGLVVSRAEVGGETIGMVTWYVVGDRAYYHLGCYTDAGYASKCSFALFRDSMTHFATRGLKWLSLGAGAGADNDGSDGLTRFKSGWASDTRPTYLCGRIFDPDRYRAIRIERGLPESDYFPAYRQGEFR